MFRLSPSRRTTTAGFAFALICSLCLPRPGSAQDNVFPSTGNAGIGTTNPQAPLEINSSGTPALLWDNGQGLLQNSADAIVSQRCGFKILLDSDNNQTCGNFQIFQDVADSSLGTASVLLSVGGRSWLSLNGDLGVGTQNPQTKLHVYDQDAGTAGGLTLKFDAGDPANGLALDSYISGDWAREFKIMSQGNGTLFGFGALVTNGTELQRGYIGGNSTANSVSATPWMTFLPGGNVGIGLTGPGYRLSVAGAVESTTGGFVFPDGTVQTTASAGGSAVYGESSSAPANSVYVGAGGYVGIGTSYPGSRLTVEGEIATANGIRFADGTLQTTAAGSGGAYGESSNAPTGSVYVSGTGYLGVGTTSPLTAVDVRGTVTAHTLEVTGGADIAEPFEISESEKILPGMVVSIDPVRPGGLRMSAGQYDRTVAGVVSGAGGVNPGLLMGQAERLSVGDHPVALTGRVWVMADASDGAIRPGDLLTTATTPGHAMRVEDHDRAVGAILGKAMTELEEGRGLVLTLVALQ